MRFGEEPGQQDGQVSFLVLGQAAAEQSKDGIPVLHWQELGPGKSRGRPWCSPSA